MRGIIKISLVTIVLVLAAGLMHAALGQMKSLIYEDEFIVCNFKNVCIVVSQDDVMNRDNISKIQNQFNHDIETFDIEDIHD